MKKIFSTLAIAALLAGFTACDEVEEGGAGPQVNPQEPVMEQNGIAVELNAATADAVSLAIYSGEETAGLVPVLKVTKLENFPEGYTLGGNMYLSANADMADALAVPMHFDADDQMLCVSVADWETAHIKLYTKNPRTVDSYVDYELTATSGSSVVRLGDLRYAYHKVAVTPLPAANIVEESYSLVIEGGATIPMVATNPDNVYDPATFNAAVVVPDNGPLKFRIRSASGKMYGGANGLLAENGPAIEMTVAGPYLVTIDMENLTYSDQMALDELIGYGSTPSTGYALTTDNYVNYSGFVGTRGATMKFTNSRNNPTMYWGYDENSKNVLVVATESSDAPMIPVEAGCHWCTVNIKNLRYNIEHIEFFELIGGWDASWGDPIKMTKTDRYGMEWEGEVTFPAENPNGTEAPIEFKIRANGNWDGCNLGGTMDNIVEHGDNILWNGLPGKYKLVLNLTTVPYTLTATAL